MTLPINTNSSAITNLLTTNKRLIETASTAKNEETAKSLHLTSRATEPLLNGETISRLQEFTACQVEVRYQEKIDLSGTPHLSWLKGRDDRIYDLTKTNLSNGANMMRIFSEIVDRTKNEQVLDRHDWQFIKSSIISFQNGLENNRIRKSESNDPIVHQVLDYICPKTQQRIEVLTQFLSTKEKAPEPEIPEFKIIEVTADQNNQSLVSSSSDKITNDKTTWLLDFLAKDLDWYDWYLGEEKRNFTSDCYFKYSQVTFALYTNVSAS